MPWPAGRRWWWIGVFLTELPAFADAHEHLMEASRNYAAGCRWTGHTSVARVSSGMVATRGPAMAAPGRMGAERLMAWHESNLAENRLPTIAELACGPHWATRRLALRRAAISPSQATAAQAAAGIRRWHSGSAGWEDRPPARTCGLGRDAGRRGRCNQVAASRAVRGPGPSCWRGLARGFGSLCGAWVWAKPSGRPMINSA
jgi:hypothetical protein